MLNRLRGVFRSLQEHEVRYLVLGGVATVLYGVPRATFDLDILVEATPENAQRLLDALLDAGIRTAEMTSVEGVLGHEITVFNDRVRIDVQTSTPGIEFAPAWERGVRMEYRGQSFPVVCKTDLIASKRASGRPIDLDDVCQLEGREPD